MGVSTDGIIFYGIDFGSTKTSKLERIWDRDLLKSNLEVEVDRHCCSQEPMYFVSAWKLVCYRGSAKKVKLPKKAEREIMKQKIAAWLEENGIKTKKRPGFFLVSYWSE